MWQASQKQISTHHVFQRQSAGCAILAALLDVGEIRKNKAIYAAQKLQNHTVIKRHQPRKNTYDAAIQRYVRQGWVEQARRDGKIFLKLTKQGELNALLACLARGTGKRITYKRQPAVFWLALFDIPEDARHIRDFLRRFLLSIDFKKLQKSVYISAYPISKTAIIFLETSDLRKFIRFMRVTDIDNVDEINKLCPTLQK